jgi:PAS domain S-box-containing protein
VPALPPPRLRAVMSTPSPTRRRATWAAQVAGVAVVYFLAAELGLSLAFVAEQISAVWPPAGVALAAVLVFGRRVWPGIALGAFAANAVAAADPMAAESLLVAAGIASGNTLEALAGAWLLQRGAPAARPALAKIAEVVRLVVLAAAGATTIAATVGVTSLCLAGVETWPEFSRLWAVWWLGDATGVLTVTPLLLAFAALRRQGWTLARAAELVVLLALVAGVSVVVFAGFVSAGHTLMWAVFPFLLWAGLRFRLLGVALLVAVLSVVAVGALALGRGPFATAAHPGLLLLQSFLAVVTITGLFLAAAMDERDRAEELRAAVAHEAERTLRAEAAFRQALESSIPAGVAAIDLQGRQFYVNRAFCELVGWSEGELVGISPPFPYWPEEEMAAIQAAFDATTGAKSPPGGFELRFQRRNGERFDALVQVSPLVGGEEHRTGWLAAVTDISERKRTETDLRHGKERYRSLVSASAQVVWTANAEGQVVDDLPTWRSFTGQSVEETLGMGWLARLHPDDLEAVRGAWMRSLADGTAHAIEFRVLAADGRYHDVLGRAVPVHDAEGRLREWVGTLTDITERKSLERELRERADALAEADRRKDEFLAMLGHELRNPLAPMVNALAILRARGLAGPHGERLRDLLERQVRHLARLVDDLLEMSRITRGEILLRIDRVDVGAVVARAAESVRPLLEERRHELVVRLPGERLTAEADAVRLEQVAVNLLNNAAKYTEPGGHIEVRVERDGDLAVLTVQDDGIGMGPDLLPHVFDLFTQGSRSLDRSQGGLGIGLTLVRRIIELHGGTVDAESDGVGKGSRLIVRLPLLVDSPDLELTAAHIFDTEPGRIQVLVVEDNKDSAETLVELLRLEGFAARWVGDGVAALAEAVDAPPDVVILDLGLPGLDGFEVARRMRALPQLAGVVIVALSGYGREEDRRRSREAGVDHHLAKPVDFAALGSLLAEVTARKQPAT